VVLFDVATGARIGRPLHPPYGPIHAPRQSRDINGIAFSRDGRLLATAGNDGSVVVWDLTGRVPIGRRLRPHPGVSVNTVAFSPDGRTLVSGVDDGTVVLTRVPDGKVLYELTRDNGPLTIALAFSPDGRTLATGAIDGKVRLRDSHTGKVRLPAWDVGGGPVVAMSFSPDGSMLAASGSEGTTALWDVRSGKRIGVPLPGPSSRGVGASDQTGHTLAIAFDDGTVLLWDIDPASWRKRACAVAGRHLTPQEWQEFLPDRPYQPSCGTR
jgi:WD40 repeat protein